MRHELHTDVTIDAPVETVWQVLIDLDAYAEWNPFISESAGRPEVGQRLTNRLSPPGGPSMTFRPTVTEVEPDRTFEWLGRLGVPGVFDGRHRFELLPNADGTTTLIHSERLFGILVPLLRKSLDTQTLAGFEAMNAALKERAEARVACTS